MAEKSKVETLAAPEKQRQEISDRIAAERGAALAEIADTARASAQLVGVSIDELVQALKRGGKHAGKAGAPAAAKYRNPKNPADTWTGKGRRPAWVIEATKGGASMDSLAIGAKGEA